MNVLGHWYGRDGTTYAVVAPTAVGSRPRWWIPRRELTDYQDALERGFDPPREVGPPGPQAHHDLPPYVTSTDEDDVVLALVIPDREPGPSDDELAAAIHEALRGPRRSLAPGAFEAWLSALPYPWEREIDAPGEGILDLVERTGSVVER